MLLQVEEAWERSHPETVNTTIAVIKDLEKNRFFHDLLSCLRPLENFSVFTQYRDRPALGPSLLALGALIQDLTDLSPREHDVIAFKDAMLASVLRRFTEKNTAFNTPQSPDPAVWSGQSALPNFPVNTPLAYMTVSAILVRVCCVTLLT